MTEVRWTEEAYEDLRDIRDRVSRDSAVYARDLASRLYDAVGLLEGFPDAGRVVPERGTPTIRELIRVQYRIVYRRHPEIVEILTIFHGARLFPNRLPGDAS